MKITIEIDTAAGDDISALLALTGDEPAKPAKTKKPTVPVAGNPDPAPVAQTPEPSQAVKAAFAEAVVAERKAAEVTELRANAPAEVTAILEKRDRESIANAVLRAVKPIAEGGVTRAVVVPKLEVLAGVAPGTAVKLGMVPDAKLEEVRQFILAQYKA